MSVLKAACGSRPVSGRARKGASGLVVNHRCRFESWSAPRVLYALDFLFRVGHQRNAVGHVVSPFLLVAMIDSD